MEAAVQFRHGAGARGLVQPVDVLGDDSGDQAALLQLRDGDVSLVGGGVGDGAPAEMTARPVPLPRFLAAGESLVGHRLPAPLLSARSPVIRYAGFGGQPCAA